MDLVHLIIPKPAKPDGSTNGNNRVSKYRSAFLFVLFFTFFSCAHIPKESVYLSEELTAMITSARASHLKLVDEYIEERRQRADAFMEEKWIPSFMERFVNSSNVLQDLERAGTAQEKGQVMLDFADAASREITSRRAALMDAMDDVDRLLKNAINAHYDDMITVNQALTAHLRAAAEVTATREDLMNQLKIRPEELFPIDKINNVLEEVITYEGKLEGLADKVKEVKDFL